MSTQKTLITALDNENNDAYVFMVTHTSGIIVWPNIVAAFREYAKTDEGIDYIKHNGSNCGDALFTPKQYLVKHGILSVKAIDCKYRVVVNHNDSVLA
jgi:hypothetical protein